MENNESFASPKEEHQIHDAVKNDPVAMFADTETLLLYDHFFRNGLEFAPASKEARKHSSEVLQKALDKITPEQLQETERKMLSEIASKEKPDFYSLLSSLVTTYQQDIEDWGIDTDKLPRKALKTIVDKIDYQNECLKTLAVGLRASYELKIAALQEEIRQLKEHSEETFKMVERTIVSGNYDTTTAENLELLSIHLRQLKNKPTI